MTKKDYEKIASVLLYNRNQCGLPDRANNESDKNTIAGYLVALNDVAYMMADKMQQDNPRFDRDCFLKACGIS